MKILVGKTFGIGNAVLAVPLIKALVMMGHEVDVLVGTTPDDFGALEVMVHLHGNGGMNRVYVNEALVDEYDIAIMAIPFDGRWKNGVHFRAKQVMDGRTRPDPNTQGLISWEKHEILYQLENAEALGWKHDEPSTKFFESYQRVDIDHDWTVYLGLGYKRDAAGFWAFKHWGNDNYVKLVSLLNERGFNVVTTGGPSDLQQTIRPIMQHVPLRFIPTTNLFQSFSIVNSCHLYVGNDTGMMHVAAACEKNVVGIFMEKLPLVSADKLITKNGPWSHGRANVANVKGDHATPEDVLKEALRCREGIRV